MTLRIDNLSVSFDQDIILKQIDLDIKEGEFISLLGRSGSGKTTLLKSIAGLVRIDEGTISVNQRQIDQLEPQDRQLSYVFQDLRLFPHLNVFQNIAFPLKMHQIHPREWEKRIEQLLEDVQMSAYKYSAVQDLSGGQQQRIALARALAIHPHILLLDEPFSGLDENLRLEMGQLIQNLQQKNDLTVIMVTHDKDEAIHYSDRIAILYQGQIKQIDTVENLVYQPTDLFTARYFGPINIIDGYIENNLYHSPSQSWALTSKLKLEPNHLAIFRPVHAHISSKNKRGENELLFKVKVKAVQASSKQFALYVQALGMKQEWTLFIDNTQRNYQKKWQGQELTIAIKKEDLSYVQRH